MSNLTHKLRNILKLSHLINVGKLKARVCLKQMKEQTRVFVAIITVLCLPWLNKITVSLFTLQMKAHK